MKYLKKASSFLLMAALLLSGTNVANAATQTEYEDSISAQCWIDNICYDIDLKNNIATFWEEKISGDTLTIPESVTYKGKKYPVTIYINNRHDAPSSKVRHIVFPDTITYFSMDTRLLPNLESLNIPKNAKNIDAKLRSNIKVTVPADQKYYYEKNNALYSKKEPTVMCLPLAIPENYTVADGTTKIRSFNSNRVVKKITLPKSVTAINRQIFSECKNLEQVDMEKTQIKNIPTSAFSVNSKLTTVKLPKQLESIGEDAFSFNSKLTTVKLPKQLESIGEDAFIFSGIKSLVFPKHLKKIGNRAFAGTKLKKVVIPDNVTYIGSVAFSGCTYLKEIVLPKKLSSVNASTFANCKKLKKITFRNTKTAPKFVKKGTIFKGCPKGIKLYVKNKKVAKSLKKQLMKTSIKKAKIYAGKKLVYKNVTGKEKR